MKKQDRPEFYEKPIELPWNLTVIQHESILFEERINSAKKKKENPRS